MAASAPRSPPPERRPTRRWRPTSSGWSREALRQGTTTIEIKSGYGLTTCDEARSLRVARDFTSETTFLGAHVVPAEFAASRRLRRTGVRRDASGRARRTPAGSTSSARRGAFDGDHEGRAHGRDRARACCPRIHANQLTYGPGVQLAVELDAASADHCTHLSDADVDALAGSSTVATLLPGAEFSTRSPYPDARRLLDAGATVALATDCNPGSSYTSSMPFCVALAVREMRMTPAEALWAATAGGARALRRTDIGHLGVGARADLAILDAPSYLHLAYRPGVPIVSHCSAQWRAGMSTVTVHNRGIGVGDVLAVARGPARVDIAPEATAAMARESLHRGRDRAGRRGRSTASPPASARSASTFIAPDRRTELQHALIRSHAAGVGAPMPREVVRAMMLLRVRSLAMGRSGVRPFVAQALVDLLNHDITPWVPGARLARRVGRPGSARALRPGAARRGLGAGQGRRSDAAAARRCSRPACTRSSWPPRRAWPSSTAPTACWACCCSPSTTRGICSPWPT